jgi:lysophospholipase L1-like esterase
MTHRESPTVPPARPSWKGRLLGVAFMCVLTVGLCEVVLSFYGGTPGWLDIQSSVHRRSATPGLTFEPAPGASTHFNTVSYRSQIAFNSYGMRGAEPAPPEQQGLIRVAAAGDSFTFGLGVQADEAWPAVLQGSLTHQDRPVEVLNFGVCAYSVDDDLAVLEHKTPAWSPRVVVMGYFFNDPDTLPINPLQRAFLPTFSPYRLKLGYFFLLCRRTLDFRLAGTADYTQMLHSERLSYWGHTLEAFDRMAALARERDVELIVAVFPRTPEDWSRYKLRPQHEQVDQALRARGIPVVDLLEEFSRHEPAEIRLSPQDDHPTVFGHQVIAETLAPVVEAAIERQTVSMR